jgi:hypothetical protein
MNYLRKIIKEEIERVLSESVLYGEPQADVFENKPVSKDDIIYNYEMGRIFANNNLQSDIDNLNEYTLSEYLPSSINRESWSFDFESVTGNILIVDIVRLIRGGKSFWSMTFAIQERGLGKLPEIKKLVEDVEGYNNFIQAVNLKMAKNIDPSNH